MKRIVIASLAALGVIAAPAIAATTSAPPVKAAKPDKQSHSAKAAAKLAAKSAKKTN